MKILQNPIFVLNKNTELLEFSCESSVDEDNFVYMLEHGHMSEEHIKLSHSCETHQQIAKNSSPVIVDSIFRKNRQNLVGVIKSGGLGEGAVVVTDINRSLTSADIDVVGLVCAIISQSLTFRHGHGNITDFMYECRLNALLDGKSTDASWIPGWLLYLHWTEHQNFYLLTLISPLGINDNQESDRLRSQLGQIKSSCSFLNDRNLILILNAKDKEALQKCVSQLSEILPQHNLKAGLSERFDNILDLPEYRQQALDALKASAILGDSALISNYQEKMVYDLLLKASNPQRCYGDYRLQVLEDYDKKNGTDYCHTLHVFMKNAFNKNQTASILFIHRNSLSYRLHKIKEILDLDLSDGEDCQKLYLAFKSRELEAALGKRLK